jgi:hypothetical protein
LEFATVEHTGLLRMGLEVAHSVEYWRRSEPREKAAERRTRAAAERWYPELSPARLRALLSELEKRFPEPAMKALRQWRPDQERQAPLICHWHLQCRDPLYREFTSYYLVEAWAQPGGVSVAAVQGWLEQRGSHREWAVSTRRRLAGGLVAAASRAGFLKGAGALREPHAVTADAESLRYLRKVLLKGCPASAEEIMLSGTVAPPR